MIKSIKQNFWLLAIEGILLMGGVLLLWYLGYAKLCWPTILIYTALKFSIVESIQNMLDEKFKNLKR